MKRSAQVDVARLAGISRATVSYAPNRQTDGRVPTSAKTNQRTLKTVAELGYKPDTRAQSLWLGSAKTIAPSSLTCIIPIFGKLLTDQLRKHAAIFLIWA